ncbi:hypothetical protein F5Y15DRAFT_426280 [Xylariaceae sp. FL0016]|nr:hypothetical protein F5Y15DRAFT_426280 [Xylariaceae sp. FL0016]
MSDMRDGTSQASSSTQVTDIEHGRIITLVVGVERRRFHVHLNRVQCLTTKYPLDPITQECELPNEDPRVFNLMVHRIYKGRFPRVKDLSCRFRKPSHSLDLVPKDEILGKRKRQDGMPESAAIPDCIPADEALEAAALQDDLLGMLILAETYRWYNLFNAAMDAFRYGESQLRRRHPCLKHLDRVLGLIQDQPLVCEFLVDYAYYMGMKNQVMHKYLALSQRYPVFWELIATRLDSPSNGPRWNRRAIGMSLKLDDDGPLEPQLSYHRHKDFREDGFIFACEDWGFKCNKPW